MPITTNPQQSPIKWELQRLTVKDVIEIIHWYNDTDIPASLAKLMIIARRCTDTPLSLRHVADVVKDFVDNVYEYQLEIARAEYERIRDNPP